MMPGGRHGIIVGNLLTRLTIHVRANALGRVFSAAGFELLNLPRTVRAPDIAFVRAERLPAEGVGAGFMRLAPDLVVEVLSPSETTSRLEEKLNDYRAAGTPLVWIIDPETRTVMVVPADGPVRRLRADDVLDGGDVIPGFLCRVAEVFEGTV
jgi:Uma2 family endonuclease